MRKFLRDGALLFSGNAWAQAVALAAHLLLTRLFTPENFALYNVFFSYIETLVILSTCKYELAVVVAPTDREAAAVSRLALRLNAAVCLLLLTLIGLLLGFDAMPGRSNMLGALALLIPPMVYFNGTSRILTELFNRERRFRPIAVSEAVTATVGTALKLLFGLLQRLGEASLAFFSSAGMPLGTLLGRMVGNVNLRLRLTPRPRDLTRAELRHAAHLHRNFPLFVMPKDLINSLSFNLPFLWLAHHFEAHEVGLYALALTIAFRPTNLVNGILERLFYVRMAERVRDRQPVLHDIRRFFLLLNAVALPLLVVAGLWAEPLCLFLFGSKWVGIGRYVRLLLPWMAIALTSTSLMFVANVFGTQRVEFRFYILLFCLRLAALFAGLRLGNFYAAIALFAAAGTLVSGALLLWYAAQLRRYEHSLAST
ncbi:MAG: oligosaccharide flippase family protein [Bacteroidales bacterium]|nr:oligosaccharide flippase family protein [Bacteroidales bacterium]